MPSLKAWFAPSRWRHNFELLLLVLINAAYVSRPTSAVSIAARIETLSPEQSEREEVISPAGEGDKQTKRWCRAEELLPRSNNAGPSSEWSAKDMVEHPYGCDCASMRSRYFCPSLRTNSYPEWMPHAISEGKCKGVTRSEMMSTGAPLPPHFKVLFYGNSHMRQAVESIMCLFPDTIAKKRVSRYSVPSSSDSSGTTGASPGRDGDAGFTQEDVFFSGDEQCRSCFDESNPHAVTSFQRALQDGSCIPGVEACRCNDDHGEFIFRNGAAVHYYFANDEPQKRAADALEVHGVGGNVSFSQYDAVFANLGNQPRMPTSSALELAAELQAENVPFFLLSTYEGHGDPGRYWTPWQRKRFRETGARFMGIDRMALGLDRFTKGVVEHMSDPHFCLPGPPNEIGLLLLKIAWAIHQRKEGEE